MKKKVIVFLLLAGIIFLAYSCANMSVGVGYGMSFGPYGMGISPSFNVGFGGGYYW